MYKRGYHRILTVNSIDPRSCSSCSPTVRAFTTAFNSPKFTNCLLPFPEQYRLMIWRSLLCRRSRTCLWLSAAREYFQAAL